VVCGMILDEEVLVGNGPSKIRSDASRKIIELNNDLLFSEERMSTFS
jgi:hypothetical protein